jgi:hypothetical protein
VQRDPDGTRAGEEKPKIEEETNNTETASSAPPKKPLKHINFFEDLERLVPLHPFFFCFCSFNDSNRFSHFFISNPKQEANQGIGNPEYEAEKRMEENKDTMFLGSACSRVPFFFFTLLLETDHSFFFFIEGPQQHTPWARRPISEEEKLYEDSSISCSHLFCRKRMEKRKSELDPLQEMNKFLGQKKKSEESTKPSHKVKLVWKMVHCMRERN